MIVNIFKAMLLIASRMLVSFLTKHLKTLGWFLLTSLPFILLKGIFNRYTIPSMFISVVMYICYAIWI